MDIVDFNQDNNWGDLFYGNPTPERVKELGQFLRSDPNRLIRLYHGTSCKNRIIEQGLLPTSTKRRHSYQSSNGYVCLSVYPNMAREFGKLAYPTDDIIVYEVLVTVRTLKADRDQLNNQRAAGNNVGNSLTESLAYGHGARVKGKIESLFICIHQN